MSQTATQETGSKEEQRAEGNGEVKTDGEGDPLPSVLIAAVKENKIDGQAQSQSQSQSQQKGEQPASGSGSGSGTDDQARAALLIQRNYRGYRSRRELEGLSISADNRWTDAVTRARLDTANKQAGGGKNDATSRWRRGGLLVGQLAGSGPTGASTSDGAQGDGPVEGGPSVGPDAGNDDEDEDGADAGAGAPPDREKDKTKGMVGQVPGSNEGGKLDNVRTIAKPNQRGLKAIERWTHGQQAQELSKVMEGQYWLEVSAPPLPPSARMGSSILSSLDLVVLCIPPLFRRLLLPLPTYHASQRCPLAEALPFVAYKEANITEIAEASGCAKGERKGKERKAMSGCCMAAPSPFLCPCAPGYAKPF